MNSRAAYLLANPPILSVNDIIDLESHRGESRRVSAQHVVGVRGRLAADGLALQFTIRGTGVGCTVIGQQPVRGIIGTVHGATGRRVRQAVTVTVVGISRDGSPVFLDLRQPP